VQGGETVKVEVSEIGGNVPDATTAVKGKLKLAGDLAGTADLPTVPELTNKQNTSEKNASNGYVGLSGFQMAFKNHLNTITSYFANYNTIGSRTYTFPDKSMTVAGTDDIPDISGKQDVLTETNFGAFMNDRTAKNTLVDADEVVSDDSADSNKAKKTTWLNVWLNYLKPKADALYAPLSSVSTMVKLSADVTSNITTETVVSDFNYAVSANTTYIIRGRLAIGCSGTGGVNLGTKFPAGATINGNALGRRSSSSDFGSAGFSTSGTLSGSLNSVNSQGGFAFVEIILNVGANAGDFQLIFASVTSGQISTIIANGSYLEYVKL
jgi:hypothetical protein